MEDWTIGQTARHFDLSPSTLRYYEQRRLVTPSRTPTGARRYDRSQLRRLAFLRLGSELGISLDVIASVLDRPRAQWASVLAGEQVRIEQHLAAARHAADLLAATAACEHAHPGRDCPQLRSAVDLVVDGAGAADLARRYGG